jgi:hypothetical protein
MLVDILNYVKKCFDDKYVFWDVIWEWLCVLKYDIGIEK